MQQMTCQYVDPTTKQVCDNDGAVLRDVKLSSRDPRIDKDVVDWRAYLCKMHNRYPYVPVSLD